MTSEVAPTLWVRRASGLVREVGSWTALAVTMCYAIGGGIHRLTWWAAYWYPGSDPVLSSWITCVVAVILMFIYAWMLATMPRTGGDYIYISRVVNPFVGFISSWGYMISAGLCLGILSFYALESFGSAMATYGLWTNNPGLAEMGGIVGRDPGLKFWLSIIFVTLFGALAYLGIRIHMYVVWIMFIVPLVCSIPMWAAYAMNTPATTQVLWDKMFGAGTYVGVQELAVKTGFDLETFGTFNIQATLLATVAPGWAWVGTWQSAPSAGGEIKEIRKSAMIGVALAGLFVAFYYIALPWLGFNAYGKMFIAQYIWDYKRAYPDLQGLIAHPPFPNAGFFAGILWVGNPILMLMPPIAVAFWMLNYLPTGYLICSRYIFSWSFDRFFPETFASVNERFHSPHNAILLSWIVGVLGSWCTYALEKGLWGAGLAALDTTFIWWWSSIPVAWAAVILPYTRKDLYEAGFKLEIAGLPVISLLGLLGVWLSTYLFLVFVMAVPAWPDVFSCVTIWFIGAIIYVAMFAYNVRRGVDIKSIYAEVPPA